jgi:hypothetical protein
MKHTDRGWKWLHSYLFTSMKRNRNMPQLIGQGPTLRGCIQKFPDWVDNETTTIINTRWEASQRVMTAKLARLTHKIAIQLHLVAESCIICSSHARRPVRKLLDTSSYLLRNGSTSVKLPLGFVYDTRKCAISSLLLQEGFLSNIATNNSLHDL